MILVVMSFVIGVAVGAWGVWWVLEGRWRYQEWQGRER